MTKRFSHFIYKAMALAAIAYSPLGCVEEPDGDNLYTEKGQTMAAYIAATPELSSFSYLLERTGYSSLVSTYGQYTCFAPSNEGIAAYVDSLYNDSESVTPHNGMIEASVEGLTDSLCLDLVRYHLCNKEYTIIDMGGNGQTISTILGRNISTSVNANGETVLNNGATITKEDIQVINGIVQCTDRVIPRTTRPLPDVLARLDDYSLFSEALQRTGLADSIVKSDKGVTYTISDVYDTDHTTKLYSPTTCKVGYTVFAESNAVMATYGIHTFDDLVDYANGKYGNAAEWYDYPREKGITISTGTDYTNRFNALNMFVAYHILYASMAQDQLVFEAKENQTRAEDKWNYANGCDPQDYYETMLPSTLLKVWEPQPGKTLYLNRYQTYNTLTNEVGTKGTNHEVINSGVVVERKDITAYNGYIHPINKMLVYTSEVPKGVLHERMRIDATNFVPELINNGFRYMYGEDTQALNSGGSGWRVAFPSGYFDNLISYNGEQSAIRYNVRCDYSHWEAECLNGWGQYDVAFRLPPLPSGTYEIRFPFGANANGGMYQFYFGTSSDTRQMEALGIPLDIRVSETDPRVGWTKFYEEDDLGIATDAAMRTRGYMRGSFGYVSAPGRGYNDTDRNCRGMNRMRLILGRKDFKQSEPHWLRLKNVLNYDKELKWAFDYIEVVPVDVVDNGQYAEDWY